MVHNKHSMHLRPGVVMMMQHCHRFHTNDFSTPPRHPWRQNRTPPHPRVIPLDDTSRKLNLIKKRNIKPKPRPQRPSPTPSQLRTLHARKRQLSTNINAARRGLCLATSELARRNIEFRETYEGHLDEKTYEVDAGGKVRNVGKFGNCDVRGEFWPESFIRGGDREIKERRKMDLEKEKEKADEMRRKAKGKGKEGEEEEEEEEEEGNGFVNYGNCVNMAN